MRTSRLPSPLLASFHYSFSSILFLQRSSMLRRRLFEFRATRNPRDQLISAAGNSSRPLSPLVSFLARGWMTSLKNGRPRSFLYDFYIVGRDTFFSLRCFQRIQTTRAISSRLRVFRERRLKSTMVARGS